MTSPLFSLPAYRVGPYVMKFALVPKSEFLDKRRILEHDWTAGVARIADHISHRKAIECVMRSLLAAIHYRSGLNDKSDEESYTHSLATGLVELARNSTEFWVALQALVEDEYKPGAGWARTARGDPVAAALTVPKRIVYDKRTCSLEWSPRVTSAYGYYHIRRGKIELAQDLRGANLALVTMHEVLHFVHECVGLRDSTKEAEFKHTQAYALLRLWQTNPKFWAWWLHVANSATDELRLAA